MDDQVWVQQVREGDTAAFERLVRAYQAPVYNLAYRMLGDRMEAEDAAQEAFLRAYQHLDRYDAGRSFRTWLLSITSHHCIDRLRRRRPVADLELAVEIEAADAPGPETSALTRERREGIQRLLGALPSDDRAAVTLLYWYDCSYEEIAEMMDTTVSAVKSRLHRARRAMAQALEDQAHAV